MAKLCNIGNPRKILLSIQFGTFRGSLENTIKNTPKNGSREIPALHNIQKILLRLSPDHKHNLFDSIFYPKWPQSGLSGLRPSGGESTLEPFRIENTIKNNMFMVWGSFWEYFLNIV